MAELAASSGTPCRRRSVLAGIILDRIRSAIGRRPAHGRIRTAEWSDYMLRDIGLAASREPADARSLPFDWPMR